MVTLSEPSVFGAMGCKHESSVEKAALCEATRAACMSFAGLNLRKG